MSAVDIARLQFATTTGIHWLFVLVTLGLVVVLVILQTRATLARDPEKRALLFRMTRFWGLLYVINYAIGIASGIIMEFQFGTNWSGLSHLVGDVFGAPLAMETLVAFVAESTFLALWMFGWGKIPKWAHLALIWLVAASAYASAFWVLVANGFMQNPVGYEMRDGRAVLTDVSAVFSNPSTIWAFTHIFGAALAVGGVVLVVISAGYLFRRTKDRDFFVRSFRMGFLLGFLGLSWLYGTGWGQYGFVKSIQPGKGADFDADTAAIQQQLVSQFGPGDYLPASGVFAAFTVMMMVAEMFTPIMMLMLPIVFGKLSARLWWAMPMFWLALPFPFVAAVGGWVFREVGRQPWIVYGVQRTSEAASELSVGTMWTSYAVFTTVLVALVLTNWWLLGRHAVRGPNREIFGIGGTEPGDSTAGEPAVDAMIVPQAAEGARHG